MPYVDATLGPDGDLVLGAGFVTGVALVEQRLRLRLSLLQGGWFHDTSRGVPYDAWNEEMPLPIENVRAEISAQLIDTPGISTISSLRVSFSGPSRRVTVDAKVVLDDGANLGIAISENTITTQHLGVPAIAGEDAGVTRILGTGGV